MNVAFLAAVAAPLGAAQAVPARLLTGTLHDRPVAEGGSAQIELKPSSDRDLPGVAAGGAVFSVETPQFRPAGAPQGLLIALGAARDGWLLFVDRNLDGRLTESEGSPYAPAADASSAEELSIELRPATPGAPVLPFRCRVFTEHEGGGARHYVQFTASFRVEGDVEIAGRRTRVSLPFNATRGTVDITSGKIGIDANGDGTVDLRGVSGPEVTFAKGERVMMRVRDTYVSVESADFAARSVVLRVHPPEAYTVIDVRVGAPLPDFAFTDFDGRARKLSEFRGKYLLLDFWGSWCAPCLADLPHLKAAYDRFRDRGFEILGIDYEHGASTDKVRALLREKDVKWTNATPESVKDLVDNRLRIWGFPSYILLDRDGSVVETRAGALSGAALLSTLQRILPDKEN